MTGTTSNAGRRILDYWDQYICMIIAAALGVNAVLPDAWPPMDKVIFFNGGFAVVWAIIFIICIYGAIVTWSEFFWGIAGMLLALVLEIAMTTNLGPDVDDLEMLRNADATTLQQVAIIGVIGAPIVCFCIFRHIRNRNEDDLEDLLWLGWRIAFALMAGFLVLQTGEFMRMLTGSRAVVVGVAVVLFVVSAVWTFHSWRRDHPRPRRQQKA